MPSLLFCWSGQFFCVPTHKDGQLLSPTQLYSLLKRVVAQSPEEQTPPLGERVGLLTAADRDSWTKYYNELMQGVWTSSGIFLWLAVEPITFGICMS